MKKGTTILLGVLLIFAVLAIAAIGRYNSIVEKEESVDTAYSNIDTQLERRADLIPNLINTVKGYMEHEKSVINDITTARENLLKAKNVDELSEANQKLDNAINALMVIVENYPDLKANQNFIALQDELAGTENRIATARRDYNEAVKDYNTLIKKFPNNIIAKMFGFEKHKYFEVAEGKTDVPEVNF